MTIYTDKKLNHDQPDIILLRKDVQQLTLVDLAVPAEQNIINTEEEKVAKYQELAFEIKRIHRALTVTVAPIVIGALGTISTSKLDIPDIVGSAQLSAICIYIYVYMYVYMLYSYLHTVKGKNLMVVSEELHDYCVVVME